MLPRIGIISLLLLLAGCATERVRIRTLEEGRLYDTHRPMLSGNTKCQQRPGIPK